MEVSAFTRRERLERIAAAERDRRAGRADLALATLGGAEEWPARVVLALSQLDPSEGEDARKVLETTLDEWAAELGLGVLRDSASHPVHAAAASELVGPIERDELERAFAEAEAEVDQMHDVNAVAERVLFEEPIGVVDLSDEALLEPVLEAEPEWAAFDAPPTQPEPLNESHPNAQEHEFESSSPAPEASARPPKLATLERWLGNLERKRTRGAQ